MAVLESQPEQPAVQVPDWNLDPSWSVRPWPVQFEFAGEWFEIEALPAADWLAVFVAPSFQPLDLILTLLDFEQAHRFSDLLIDCDADLDQLVLDIVATVTARKWWIAFNLFGVAIRSWQSLGAAMLQRTDATRVSIAAWLDIFTALLAEMAKPESATMLFMQIELPPEGEESDPFEMEVAQFLSLGDN